MMVSLTPATHNGGRRIMAATIRHSLNGLDCTTKTGRRMPGPEPTGLGRLAHQTSPRLMAQCFVLSRGQGGIQFDFAPITNCIDAGRDVMRAMSAHEARKRFCIQLAAGFVQGRGENFGLTEDAAWDGYCDFHALKVSPGHDFIKRRPRRSTTPAAAMLACLILPSNNKRCIK